MCVDIFACTFVYMRVPGPLTAGVTTGNSCKSPLNLVPLEEL